MEEKKKGKALWIALGAAVVLIAGVCVWFFLVKQPYDTAVANFQADVQTIEAENANLDQVIGGAQALVDAGEPPFDETVLSDAEAAIAAARQAKRAVPEMPEKTEEINAETQKLTQPLDYSAVAAAVQDAQKALEASILLMKQVTNPPEDFIVERLEGLASIDGVQAVTEDHDPNGNLNKQGGYTAAVYFASPLIDPATVYGEDIVDKGTEGGGCVEVYATVEDAEARNTYLSAFDSSGLLNSGSHTVLGTIVIRTSDKLTASQQKDLEQEIWNALLA